MKQTRFLAVLAVVAVSLAAAACGGNEADFEAALTSDAQSLVITRYRGDSASVRVPASIRNMPVREIGEAAFSTESCPVQLKSAVIPEGVTTIGRSAFRGQGALTKITLPASLAVIADYAFADTGLNSIRVPDSVTSLAPRSFRGANVASVTLPAGLTEIPPELFADCDRLKTIVIPEGVTGIGNKAFSGCVALGSVTLPGTLISIGGSAFDGCSSLAVLTIPAALVSLDFGYEGHAFAGCSKLPLETQARLNRLGYRGLWSRMR